MKIIITIISAVLLFQGIASPTVYDVGPTFAKTNLRDVSWSTLKPGDVVNIHCKPGGYHEKIQISQTGTAAQHILIRGIPDPNGALPIIDGQDAIEDPNVEYRNGISNTFGIIMVTPRATGYVYGNADISFIDIENLDVRNALYRADGSITFTDQFGAVHGYNSFACAIYVEWAKDFAVRGCELHHCDNGFFANSNDGYARASARILLEGNYFHDNGLPATPNTNSNGFHEHDCYVESAGVIYQYNRFGPMRPGCHGVAIKDRSSGTVIRYNEFELGEHSGAIYVLQPQGGEGFIEKQPNYKEVYVYGNKITIQNYASSVRVLDLNSDNSAASYAALHRGTLYFFNNTVVNHHNRLAIFGLTPSGYTGALPTYENIDCRNNIFFTDTVYMNATYEKMIFSTQGTTNGGGDINLNGPNWISPGWAKESPGHPYGGALNGVANLIVGDAQGANNPGFVDMNAQNYRVLTGSNVLDAGGALAPVALALGHTGSLEYLAPQSFQPRVQLGAAMDLGAFESSGTPPPPPPGGALQFSSAAYSVSENAGDVMVTVTRSGGSTGAVSVAYNVSGGTAAAGSDFTASNGVLNWPDGDLTSRSFIVTIIDDASVENAESIQLTLTNISGGAGYGAPTSATLTINDNDLPSSQPIVAVTASGNLISFNSSAPGTLLGNIAVTGIDPLQTIRGLAFRRSTGQLYVVGAEGGTGPVAASLYLLNPASGVLTLIADITSPLLEHPSFDLGINPATDQLHIMGSTGQNLRLNPDTGAVIAVDTPFAFAAGDTHFGSKPGIVGADFTPGLTPTVYGIDKKTDSLVRIGSVGGSPLGVSSGAVSTIGALGSDAEGLTGLDFSPGGIAYAVLNPGVGTSSNLYIIDTLTGHATSLGQIGVAEQVRDLVVATPGDISFTAPDYTVGESQGSVAINVARTGGSWGAVSVDFTASDGSATASDYSGFPATLTWQDGESGVKTVYISITSDSTVEGDESVSLALSGASGGALLLAPATSILTITDPPYQHWKLLNFGANANDPLVTGDAISASHDGIPNLIKYACGISPLIPSASLLQTLDASHAFSFQHDPAATDVTLTVEVSTELTDWKSGSQYSPSLGDIPTNAWTTQLSRQLDPFTGLEQITVQRTPPAPPSAFIRLRASQP